MICPQYQEAALKERFRVAVMARLSKGQSNQILPDDTFRAPLDLRQALEQCITDARSNNDRMREISLQNLHMNDGRHVTFSREARAAIDPKTVESIRCALHPVLPSPARLPPTTCRLRG